MPRIDRRVRRRPEGGGDLWPAPTTFAALHDAITRSTDQELRSAIELALAAPRTTRASVFRLEGLEDAAAIELENRTRREKNYYSKRGRL
jgi:hypothetical protein